MDNELPSDLIPTKAACKLIPSPKDGARTALSTIYRWCASGRLRWWRNGRYRLVSRAEVLALMQPCEAGKPPPRPARAGEAVLRAMRDAETKRILTEAGLI